MLTITLPDGQQVSVTVAVMSGRPRTYVSHRPTRGACWEPLSRSAPVVDNDSGWLVVEAAVARLAEEMNK